MIPGLLWLISCSEPIKKTMLARGPPWPDPVLVVIRIPCLPLTSTYAKPARATFVSARITISGILNAPRAGLITLCLNAYTGFFNIKAQVGERTALAWQLKMGDQ
jgi:hypothetical protein